MQEYQAWQTERRLKTGDLWQGSGYIFIRASGAALNPDTAVSILPSNGVDALTVSKMLGHADTSTTMDTYGHAMEEAKRKAAECIADTILRKKTE